MTFTEEMQAVKRWSIFDSHLRTKCLLIGYWHLIAILFNILCHVIIVFILTNGFRCEISKETIRAVQWGWLEPMLLIINFGAHGFYSFPLIFNYHIYYNKASFEYLPIPERDVPCFSGMSHLNIIDIMYIIFNFLWLKFVFSFITAVHKKDPGPMITFFVVTTVKLVIQLANFCVQSSYNNPFLDIVYKIIDVCLIILFLITIKKYIIKLRKDKNRQCPPAFLESLFDGLKRQAEEKQHSTPTMVVTLEEKPTLPEVTKEKF